MSSSRIRRSITFALARCPRHARGVHKPAAGIDAYVRLHAEVPLIALLRGMHLRIALARLVLGGGGGGD